MRTENFDSAQNKVQVADATAPKFEGADHPFAHLNGSKTRLSPGDHDVTLPNGRQFSVHIPQTDGKTELPVMFVISPSVNAPAGYDAKDWPAETGMSKEADKDNFIAVYPQPLKHLLGRYEQKEGFAWNAPGSGIDAKDQKFAGYDDVAFIKDVVKEMPKLANVDPEHKDWGAVAFSQGGLFLNELSHEIPHLFPSLGLVGTTMETNHDYSSADGNAHNVMIVNLRGDKSVLPFPGIENGTWQYNLQKAAGEVVPHEGTMWIAEHTTALGAIDNRNQDPNLMMKLYSKQLASEGAVDTRKPAMDTPKADVVKDQETLYTPKSASNPDRMVVYDLPTSQHAYPGPDRGARVNGAPKYGEFDTSAKFAEFFSKYNERLKASGIN